MDAQTLMNITQQMAVGLLDSMQNLFPDTVIFHASGAVGNLWAQCLNGRR